MLLAGLQAKNIELTFSKTSAIDYVKHFCSLFLFIIYDKYKRKCCHWQEKILTAVENDTWSRKIKHDISPLAVIQQISVY